MESFIAFVTIISLASSVAIAQSNVTRGSSLKPTGDKTSWLSPSGLYAFGFYPQSQGYAVGIYIAGIPERTVVWTATRDKLPFTHQSIGVFHLIMQTDGNLVLYPDMVFLGSGYWDTGTNGDGPNVTLNLDSSGSLYLLQNSSFFIRNLTQEGYPEKDALYLMKLDVDGILRLYYHDLSNMSRNGTVRWTSSLDKCTGKGLCGPNGYCVVENDASRCRCIPGFEAIDVGRRSLGCRRTYTVENCKILDAETAINMTNLNNVALNEATYAIPKASTQDECSYACLNDCNCEVALFTGQECRLQRLPLSYIEVTDSQPNVALIKVYSSTVNNGSNPTNQSTHIKKVREKKIMVIGVSIISFAVLVLLISGVIMYKTRVWAYKKISENLNVQFFEDMGPRAFSYEALENITDGFKEELGRGSFGIVYKDILYGSNNKKPKPCWMERMRMAIDIAHGILYLHEECENPIIHCDIKPQNILMDEYEHAKISDFGLAKLLEHDQTKTSTLIRGTRGYVAPEWHKMLPITVKVDVYSFGIVLFNILCCRRNVDNSLSDSEAILEEWVYECYEAGELLKLVDYDEDVELKRLEQMVKIGLWCIQEEPSLRPSMKRVVLMLEGTVKIPLPPNPASFLSVV
ncbi:hypothetical protein E3N88_37806 [Mikania micrantha]|uniref:Protein kinase domain-containing protein n=1 Tax=Mikania micrantha TaxID=192012 RepID=A0A5N6LS85_9ASTR|nr:hypothetical protein E3N88_37806 [Mikania micrantha]